MFRKVVKLTTCILTLCMYNAQCQNIYFDRLYDFGNGTGHADASGGIINGIDSNEYYFISRTINLNTNVSNGVLCKIDEYGDTIFTVKISDENYSYIPTALIKSNDNSITIASTVTNIATNKKDYSLAKINSNHEIEFVKSYGDSINNEQALHVINAFDKGFLIVGQSVVPPNVSADMYAVKTDSAGNFEWEKYYGGNSFEAAYSAIQTPDSGYLMLGWTQSFGNGDRDFYLVKTDSYGNQQWQKTYGNNGVDVGSGIIELRDGNYLLSGGNPTSGRLIKINPDGIVIWQKSYSYINSEINFLYWVKELDDYTIAAVGGTHNQTENDAGWLVKTDSAGNQLWERKYNKTNTVDLFYDFTTANDGGFVLCGSALNTSNNSQDAWLLKVDSVGCAYENCLVGIDDVGSKRVLVDVWPNPATEILNIELQESSKSYEVEITDINGQVVYKSEIRNQKSEIDVRNLADGLYLLTLQNNEQRTTLKIIIQH